MFLKYVVLIVILLSINGCGGEQSYEKTLYVDHYMKGRCYGFGLGWCAALTEFPDSKLKWSAYSGFVSNFDYKWGYLYKIKVRVHKKPTSGEDGPPALTLTLLEILEKNRVSSDIVFYIPFEDRGEPFKTVVKISDGLYKIANEKEISCSTTDCATIDNLIAQNMSMVLEFRHPLNPADPLLVTQILCNAAQNESFGAKCAAYYL